MADKLSLDQAFRELVLSFEVAETKDDRIAIMGMIRELAEMMIKQEILSPEILDVVANIQMNLK